MLALRESLPGEEAASAALLLTERMLAMPEVAGARTVLAFWPMTARGEVDIRPLVRTLSDRGVTVGLPVIRAMDRDRIMSFGRYTVDGGLVPGPFGTLQPPDGDPVDGREADVVIVPALAATRSGDRLGYGGGYYDRFLSRTRAFTAIPLFSRCLVDSLPVHAHDHPVDAVVTELEEIRTRRPA